MTAQPTTSTGVETRSRLARLGGQTWNVIVAWAAVTGIAPHVLHHVGPLAGTALVAGAGGQLLFARRAKDVLAERYVRGEIDTDEYHTRARELEKAGR